MRTSLDVRKSASAFLREAQYWLELYQCAASLHDQAGNQVHANNDATALHIGACTCEEEGERGLPGSLPRPLPNVTHAALAVALSSH